MIEMECGCKFIEGNWTDEPRIEYCAKHGAVDDLLEAAEYTADKLSKMLIHDHDEYLFIAEILAKNIAAIRHARGEA